VNNQEVSTAYVGSTEIKEARLGTQLVLAPGGDALWYKANEIPTLDLRFADNKSLVDATTGNNLVTFSRASDATYVDSQGVIRTALIDEPRFDHNPSTGESLGLLVEEARTNSLLRSAEINDAAWFKFTTTVSPNVATSPDGTQTADNVIPDAVTGLFYVSQTVTTVVSTVYTFSFYAKANGFSWVFADAFDGTNRRTWFNLANGTLGTVAAGTTAAISAAGNGWYRCSISLAAGAASIPYAIAVTSANNVFTGVTGNGVNGVLVWGAQLEAGAFPTSYIKTEAATATRAADVASITGTNFSSWYRQDEGTVFVSASRDTGISTINRIASITDGTNNNRVFDFRQDTSAVGYAISVTSGVTDLLTTLTLNANSRSNKLAIAQQLNNGGQAVNGTAYGPDTSVAMPVVNQLNIGNLNGGTQYGGQIARLTFWPQRLSNATLQSITQ
jgi:hypothetical protein